MYSMFVYCCYCCLFRYMLHVRSVQFINGVLGLASLNRICHYNYSCGFTRVSNVLTCAF